MSVKLRAPFSWFGGKRHAAKRVWDAIGNVAHYVEPFCGSAAVLLARPHSPHRETVNDSDGMVSNFWRAAKYAPDSLAEHAAWPCNEVDLHARHQFLIASREGLTERLIVDPEWCDPRIAGWWAWGSRIWIGSGWCGEKAGRQLPDIDPTGRNAVEASKELTKALSERLRNVDVACGDWTRILSKSSLRTDRVSSTGVYLDPPYTDGAQQYAVGGTGTSISAETRAWAMEHGTDTRLRIVLSGYAGEHDSLEAKGWRVESWKANGGYGNGNAAGNENAKRERLWLSPACLGDEGLPLFGGRK